MLGPIDMDAIRKSIEEKKKRELPDFSNIVYCDKHPGVKMQLADTWSRVEMGDLSAGVNPRYLWVCSKLDCDRHYEPVMFGYHINQPYRRLDDAATQPRCNHPFPS